MFNVEDKIVFNQIKYFNLKIIIPNILKNACENKLVALMIAKFWYHLMMREIFIIQNVKKEKYYADAFKFILLINNNNMINFVKNLI